MLVIPTVIFGESEQISSAGSATMSQSVDPEATLRHNIALKRQNESLVRELKIMQELVGPRSGVLSRQVTSEIELLRNENARLQVLMPQPSM